MCIVCTCIVCACIVCMCIVCIVRVAGGHGGGLILTLTLTPGRRPWRRTRTRTSKREGGSKRALQRKRVKCTSVRRCAFVGHRHSEPTSRTLDLNSSPTPNPNPPLETLLPVPSLAQARTLTLNPSPCTPHSEPEPPGPWTLDPNPLDPGPKPLRPWTLDPGPWTLDPGPRRRRRSAGGRRGVRRTLPAGRTRASTRCSRSRCALSRPSTSGLASSQSRWGHAHAHALMHLGACS